MRFAVLLLSYILIGVSSKGLEERFSWTRIDYQWPATRSVRHAGGGSYQSHKFWPNFNAPKQDKFTDKTSYIYENNIPMSANIWKNKVFVTVPRRRLGVPSTLNYIDLNKSPKQNPPLIPYPNWDINLYPKPSNRRGTNFVSVYRVGIDHVCDRLYFVDTGKLELPGNITQVQPAALVVMDLKTNEILRRYEFDDDDVLRDSSLASVTLDQVGDCDDTYVYIPDLSTYRLLVYSYKQDRAWHLSHNYFYLEPLAGEFSVGGHRFQWDDGIFSVALTEKRKDGHRDAYFHAMAGTHLYRVSTKILRNETLARRSYHGSDFQVVGDRGPLTQTSASDLDKGRRVLFMGLVNRNGLGCWNLDRPIRDFDIIHEDQEKMIYPCDVKLSNDVVVMLTNAMPVFLYGRLNYDQINFRVWLEDVKTAIADTKCV